jgi:hypothetical protein
MWKDSGHYYCGFCEGMTQFTSENKSDEFCDHVNKQHFARGQRVTEEWMREEGIIDDL